MPKNRPDEQRVYMALRHEFVDSSPSTSVSEIKKRLAKRRVTLELTALIQEYNADNVSNVAKKLLEEGVYQSTLRAKLRFPELFEVSQAQSADREASEAEAARHEAESLNVLDQDDVQDNVGMLPTEARSKGVTQERQLLNGSLYLVYLPLQTQHRLLVEVQKMLEKVCFKFGTVKLQSILEQKNWDCVEAVELNVWTGVLRPCKGLFTAAQLEQVGKPFPELLSSIANLRHAAVHRQRVTAKLVGQFLQDAESLIALLEDETSSEAMAYLRRRTQFTIGEIERNKDLLGTKLVATQKEFARRRKELDDLEKVATAEMQAEDFEYQKVTGERLEEDVDRASAGRYVGADSEAGTDHETDEDDLVRTYGSNGEAGLSD